jgi:hypothetical protein
MNIVGFGKSKVEALMGSGYIKDVSDIYNLKNYKDEILEANIIGREKSVNNLLNAIEESKDNNIDKLITGLGIKNVGKQSAKVLAETFKDMDEVASASYDDLINLPDFGDTMVNDIIKYFRSEKYHTIISKLKEYSVNIVSKSSETKADDNRFEGMTFVITGTLPTMKRDEASSIIQSFGGKVSSSVSKKTSYLLAGEEAGSKLTKAETLGIAIIDENKFKEMINAPFVSEITDFALSVVDENTEERAVSDKESCSFSDNEYILKAAFSKEEEVSTLVLREDLRFSQRIESFEIYAKLNGEYKKIGNGTVIGSKKILFLKEKVKTSELLIAVTGTRENPVIRDIAFYN